MHTFLEKNGGYYTAGRNIAGITRATVIEIEETEHPR